MTPCKHRHNVLLVGADGREHKCRRCRLTGGRCLVKTRGCLRYVPREVGK